MNHTLENIEIIRDKKAMSMNPKKFIVWLFIVSITMLFVSLTSAYIVKQSQGTWLRFDLPGIFWFTSGVIILSSAFLQLAYVSAKKNNIAYLKMFLTSTVFLGIVFLVGQFESWKKLVAEDVYLVGNPSGSFLYILTGLHALHLVSGIIFLVVVLYAAFKYKIHSRNMTQMEMCTTYWHFLGGLWLYLFLFLKLNH